MLCRFTDITIELTVDIDQIKTNLYKLIIK